MVDISTIEYDVELITGNGVRHLINDALLSLEWEEQDSELAQRVTIRISNMSIGYTELFVITKLCCPIFIYAKWSNAPRELIFEGVLWEWQPVESSRQKELTVTAYDRLIYLQKSQDYKYYSAGMTTQSLIGDICNTWGIPLSYKWGQSITHEKKVFNGTYISGMIIGLLEEVRKKTGEKYVAYWRNKALQIIGYGTNKDVYKFENVQISTMGKLTLNNLVTRVKIIGKADNDGNAPVEAVVDGDTRYGVLQNVLQTYDSKSIADAQAEADNIIKEQGKPEEQIKHSFPDLPFLRKGDRIELADGFYNVLGVSHNATQKQMTLTLDRTVTISKSNNNNANDTNSNTGNNKTGTFEKSDTVILNGSVYVDSYGSGKGRTFANYHSTITIVATLTRACPYHVGSVGWVYPESLTKG
jgi:hypothetical protein